MPCAESGQRVEAYFDGELDALASQDFERHLEGCADCRVMLEDLERMRATLRRELAHERTPPALRTRLLQMLDSESSSARLRAPAAPAPGAPSDAAVLAPPRRQRRPLSFWWGALGGFATAAIAAGAAFFLITPAPRDGLVDELVSAHIRSLMPAHLIDVESTDRHTVKPWFAGHADVSPTVADFVVQGYRLIGGRADYLDHQRAAVVVYAHGAHIINVFSWAARDAPSPGDTTRNGYHLACWKTGNLDYCAVSDTGWDELKALQGLIEGASADPPAASAANGIKPPLPKSSP